MLPLSQAMMFASVYCSFSIQHFINLNTLKWHITHSLHSNEYRAEQSRQKYHIERCSRNFPFERTILKFVVCAQTNIRCIQIYFTNKINRAHALSVRCGSIHPNILSKDFSDLVRTFLEKGLFTFGTQHQNNTNNLLEFYSWYIIIIIIFISAQKNGRSTFTAPRYQSVSVFMKIFLFVIVFCFHKQWALPVIY